MVNICFASLSLRDGEYNAGQDEAYPILSHKSSLHLKMNDFAREVRI